MDRRPHPYLLLCRPGETPSRELAVSVPHGNAVTLLERTEEGFFETKTYPFKRFVYGGITAKCIELPDGHEKWTRSRPMTGHYADLPEPAEVAKMLTVKTSPD